MKEFKWINPEEKLPEESLRKEVLVCYKLSGTIYYDTAFFYNNMWKIGGDDYYTNEILAWSYIPEFKK